MELESGQCRGASGFQFGPLRSASLSVATAINTCVAVAFLFDRWSLHLVFLPPPVPRRSSGLDFFLLFTVAFSRVFFGSPVPLKAIDSSPIGPLAAPGRYFQVNVFLFLFFFFRARARHPRHPPQGVPETRVPPIVCNGDELELSSSLSLSLSLFIESQALRFLLERSTRSSRANAQSFEVAIFFFRFRGRGDRIRGPEIICSYWTPSRPISSGG